MSSITQVALTGLNASRVGLNISARNTANLSTDGYSRQTVSLSASDTGGVQVNSLIRHSDTYLLKQVLAAQSSENQYSATESYYSELESVMGLSEGGVGEGVDAFFTSLDEVSTDPTSVALRQQVITAAQDLSSRLTTLGSTMETQMTSARQQSSAVADQVNGLSSTISELNASIVKNIASGGDSSELMDQREAAVSSLSKLVGVNVINQNDGSLDVSLSNGAPLVIGSLTGKLKSTTKPDGSFTLSVSIGAAEYGVSAEGASGTLGGLYAYATGTLSEQRSYVNALSKELATSVNDILATGYGTDGQAGPALFVYDANTGKLTVSDSITQAKLGLSASASEPGNSDKLKELVALRLHGFTLPDLGDVTLSDAYTLMVGKLGSDSKANQASQTTTAALSKQALLNLDAVRGVSSEEEATNISELAQIYQANMKVISVANDLLQNTLDAF
jgi:flagellar hook-associated protein 1